MALTIEARVAGYVVDDLQRRQLPVDGVLKEAGLRRRDLANAEARLPYTSVIGLIERAATLTGDACFGLRLGASRDTRERGLLGFLALNSPTLMDAMMNLQRYAKIARESEDLEIERQGTRVVLRFRETDRALRGLRHNADYLASSLVRSRHAAGLSVPGPGNRISCTEFVSSSWTACPKARPTSRLRPPPWP